MCRFSQEDDPRVSDPLEQWAEIDRRDVADGCRRFAQQGRNAGSASSLAASRLSAELEAHVDAVATAAEHGRDAAYEAALAALDDADAAIAGARELRDLLADTVEVTTLDEWLDRSEAYDVALRALYTALDDVGGRVTTAVREAIAAEEAARARLPPDARGLVVIMADIGRGGMNGAVIAIEEARGRLAEVLVEGP